MKAVRALDCAPGLERFRRQEPDGEWEAFTSHRKSRPYKSLKRDLFRLQHGLCAYCECELDMDQKVVDISGDAELERKSLSLKDSLHLIQVEHVHAKSLHTHYASGNPHLDPQNLIACCKGERPKQTSVKNPGRRQKTTCCGQAKDDTPSDKVLDPRMMNIDIRIFRVSLSGIIEPDVDGCSKARIAPELAKSTIETLNLNHPILVAIRRSIWEKLDEKAKSGELDSASYQTAVRHLTCNNDGNLLPYWTTLRTFFAALAEEYISSLEAHWLP